MCDPVTAMALTAVGTSAASSTFQIIGDTARYNAEKNYQQNLVNQNRQQIEQNRQLATQEYLNKVRLEQLAESQEKQAIVEQRFDLAKERRAAQATAKVGAAEAGVAGVSLDHLLRDFERNEAFAMGRILANQSMQSAQRKERINTYKVEHQLRSNSISFYQPAPIRKPDYFQPILSGVNSGLQAFKPAAK